MLSGEEAERNFFSAFFALQTFKTVFFSKAELSSAIHGLNPLGGFPYLIVVAATGRFAISAVKLICMCLCHFIYKNTQTFWSVVENKVYGRQVWHKITP